MNRLINGRDLNAIYITGPGHGGPGLVANTYHGGTYSELYPNVPQTEAGMRQLFMQFSFPGGVPSHVAPEQWMKSYRPEELFDANGRLHAEIAALAPKGDRRMGANPHANGGLLLKDLDLPDFRDYAVDVPKPGTVEAEEYTCRGRLPARCHAAER